MNRLEIWRRLVGIPECGGDTWVIDFAIDGLASIDRVRAVAPQLFAGPHPGGGGGRFVGVTESLALLDGGVFLGENHPHYSDEYEGLIPLLVCSDCGIPFCDGIWTRIRFSSDVVTWSGLGLVSDQGWQPVCDLDEAEFERAEYEAAFAEAMERATGDGAS